MFRVQETGGWLELLVNWTHLVLSDDVMPGFPEQKVDNSEGTRGWRGSSVHVWTWQLVAEGERDSLVHLRKKGHAPRWSLRFFGKGERYWCEVKVGVCRVGVGRRRWRDVTRKSELAWS